MIYSRRGLSAVVTTLIIILLSLVAIGIIWVVVNNVLEGGAETTEIGAKCLQVDIKATAASCNAGNCNVTYNRKSGGDAIDGIKIVMSDGQNSVQTDVPGNVAPLAIVTKTNVNATTLSTPSSVQIAAYFVDASGQEQVCTPGSAFEF